MFELLVIQLTKQKTRQTISGSNTYGLANHLLVLENDPISGLPTWVMKYPSPLIIHEPTLEYIR